MTHLKRLRLLTGGLGAAAAAAVLGSSVWGDGRNGRPDAPPADAPRASAAAKADEFGRTLFSALPAVAYQPDGAATLFAWQVKPTLAAQSRPRDLVVMVDTSASQAGGPLVRARQILALLAKESRPGDRVDVWTVNIADPSATRSLTAGLVPATGDGVQAALGLLADKEFGAGAVDLKHGVEAAAAGLTARGSRQQAIVYLGDGESSGSREPLTEELRVELGRKLAERQVGFFAVPIGSKVHAHNLHGLASTTGGAVVRVADDLLSQKGRDEAGARLKAALDTPVMHVTKADFGPEVAETFPSRLPPLRGDRPTLVVGTLKGAAPALTATLAGTVGGKAVSVELAERLPAAEGRFAFLKPMLEQWKAGKVPDAPAMLAADRALAMAQSQFGLFRDEFLTQAAWAVSANKLDHAEHLYRAAARVDAESPTARAGLEAVDKLRKGGKPAARQQEPPAPAPGGIAPPPAPGGVAPAATDPAIDRALAARAVQEQEFRVLVDNTLRQARQLRESDPDTAYQDLKRQRDNVANNDQLSDAVRRRLVGELDDAMRYIQTQGAEIRRRLDAERERIAAVRQRLTETSRQEQQERQTKARIDQFRELMQRARFEEAYNEAQVMIAERVDRGLPIPVEALGSYRIGQSAYNLRELRELKRIRENNYLLTMLQTEKSFVPYPDEPPVHFPPARVWQELTARRVANNASLRLGPNTPQSLLDIQDALENKTVLIEQPIANMTFRAFVDLLRERYKIQLFPREDLFRAKLGGEDINEKTFKAKSIPNGLKLGSFLDITLLDFDASYIVRPDYIEIVPKDTRLEEKQFRVFEVADLVTPIPLAADLRQVQQSLNVSSAQQLSTGQALGAANFTGGFAGFGGGFGGGGLGGGLGGALGGGALGAGGGAVGQQLNQQGQQQNLGLGGGVFGVTGGQLGQFGNLGGQFGLQGGNQSAVLVDLIRLVVAYREWDTSSVGFTAPPSDPNAEDTSTPILPANQLNTIGFYPPSLGLVVRGTARYHTNQSFKLKSADAGMGVGAGGPALERKGGVARGQQVPPNIGAGLNNVPGPALGAPRAQIVNPKETAKDVVARAGKEPEKVWNEAFGRPITDPKLVAAAAEMMFEAQEYRHAAEAIKAAIRKGRTAGNWAYDALAIALQQGQAAPHEVERVALSGVDLEPTDAKAYLKAAKAESELGNAAQAMAFCQRAAALEPNSPAGYADALRYADQGADVQADVVHWAVANLVRRDFPRGETDPAKELKERAPGLAKKLAAAGKNADADKLTKALEEPAQRDLVVELLWIGAADLDLTVHEPAGSVCSPTHRRTTGGGVLKGDLLEQRDDGRAEVYAAAEAFPGTYVVGVKTALGKATGGRATLKVTKYQGTPHEAVELHSVDLANPASVHVTLEQGSRQQLATVPADDSPIRAATTGAPLRRTGMTAGTGAGAGNLLAAPAAAATAVPVVAEQLEAPAGCFSAALPVRVSAQVRADRKGYDLTASPVFVGAPKELPTPKAPMLPGAE